MAIATDLGYLFIGLGTTELGVIVAGSVIEFLEARNSRRREVLEAQFQAIEIARILGDKAWEARQEMHQAMIDARRQRS